GGADHADQPAIAHGEGQLADRLHPAPVAVVDLGQATYLQHATAPSSVPSALPRATPHRRPGPSPPGAARPFGSAGATPHRRPGTSPRGAARPFGSAGATPHWRPPFSVARTPWYQRSTR